ncbi:MAG: hypothetical protein ACLTDR_05830 [Adlercreutzia equolifaciens]
MESDALFKINRQTSPNSGTTQPDAAEEYDAAGRCATTTRAAQLDDLTRSPALAF